MGNQSISPPKPNEGIPFEECRKHCTCFVSTLKAMAESYLTDEAFSEYASEPLRQKYSLIPDNKKGMRRLTEDEIPFVLACVKDWAKFIENDSRFPAKLLSLVNKIYLEKDFRESWEYCLDHKSDTNKIHDYLYGCNSGCINDENVLRHRYGHQFCISTASLQEAEKLLTKKLDVWLKDSKTFDELYDKFRTEERKSIGGLGPLSVYDACLRIAWKENRELMPGKIYLHSGVRWGGVALYHISRLTGIDWYVGTQNPNDISPDTPSDPELFKGFLPEIPGVKDRTHHLQNQLCCFHEPFFLIETAIRVQKNEKLRKEPKRIINNAKKALERAKTKAKREGLKLKKSSFEDYIGPQVRRYLKLLEFLDYDIK